MYHFKNSAIRFAFFFEAKFLSVLESQLRNFGTWATQNRLTLRYSDRQCLTVVKWGTDNTLMATMRIKVILCIREQKCEGTRMQHLQLWGQ